MRPFPPPFHELVSASEGTGSTNLRLSGQPPSYSAPPLDGEVITTNLVLSDAGDYTATGATIASVEHFVLAEQSPGVVQTLSLFDAGLIDAAPGDILRVRATVTDSLGNSASFTSAAVVVALPAPVVLVQPSLSASVVVGATTFTVDFGSAGPVGNSGMLGDYSPSLSPIFAINGVNSVSQLTLLAGSVYTRTGSALPAGAVVEAQAAWFNAAGEILSSVASVVASGFGFEKQVDETALLKFTSGTDVGLSVVAPSGLSGSYTLTAAQQSDLPQNKKAPVISGTGTEGETLNSVRGLWLADSEVAGEVVTNWQRDTVDIPGATNLTYILGGADASTSIRQRETLGGKTVYSNAIAVGSSSKTVTYLFGEANSNGVATGVLLPFTSDFSGVAPGSTLIIGVSVSANQSSSGILTGTFGGSSAERLDKSNEALSRMKMAFFKVTHPGGSPVFAITLTGAAINRSHMAAWRVTGTSGALKTRASFEKINGASPGVLDLDTTNGDLVFAVTGGDGNNGATQATTGAGTVAYSNTIPTNLTTAQFYGVLATTTEVSRDVNTTWSNTANIAGLAITI